MNQHMKRKETVAMQPFVAHMALCKVLEKLIQMAGYLLRVLFEFIYSFLIATHLALNF